MDPIKQIPFSSSVRPNICRTTFVLSLMITTQAESYCLPPERPFAPEDAQALSDYADIIGRDFDFYFREVQTYLRCLDEERARALAEATEVTNEYRRVWEVLRRVSQ